MELPDYSRLIEGLKIIDLFDNLSIQIVIDNINEMSDEYLNKLSNLGFYIKDGTIKFETE